MASQKFEGESVIGRVTDYGIVGRNPRGQLVVIANRERPSDAEKAAKRYTRSYSDVRVVCPRNNSTLVLIEYI